MNILCGFIFELKIVISVISSNAIVKGDMSNETFLGYKIIMFKFNQNSQRSLEGCVFNLEMGPNFTKLLDQNHAIYECWLHY